MGMALLTAHQGYVKSYASLQINNNDGTPATNIYTSGAVLSAQVWEGQNQASLFTPTVAWTSPTGYTLGTFTLTLPASGTLTLNPGGEYYVLVYETTSSVTAPVWQGRLKIFAAPGSTSPSPPDLITYDFAEGYCSILGLTDTQRDVLPYIVAGASMAARRFCQDRNFDQRTYTEFHDIGLNGQIRLLQPPIQIVQRVQGPPSVALTISNTSTAVQAAQVYFAYSGTWNGYSTSAQTPTGITLSRVASGTVTTSTVSFVANQTISALATLINAVGSGWTATADSTLGLWPVTELDGGYVGQGCATGAIPNVGAQFSVLRDLDLSGFRLDTRRTGFLLVGRQNTLAYQWGPGGDQLFGSPYGWCGRAKVTYVGGETVIPMQVQQAVAELVKWDLTLARTDMILESETAQEYSYKLCTKMMGAMPDNVRQKLSPFVILNA